MNKPCMKNTKGLSKSLTLFTCFCLMMLAVHSHEDKTSFVALRGYESHRSLQDNECVYFGGVGWYFCSDEEFSCKDGYKCEPHPVDYVGVQCVDENCCTGPDCVRADDDDDEDDIEDDDNDEDDDQNCWKEPCSPDKPCTSQGTKCFYKGEGDVCGCRDPTNSQCEVTGNKDFPNSDSKSDPADSFSECKLKDLTQSPSHSPSHSPSQTPTQNPTSTPTQIPIQTSTPMPTSDPMQKPSDLGPSTKSKKFKRRNRRLSHMDEMEGNVPTQRLRGT